MGWLLLIAAQAPAAPPVSAWNALSPFPLPHDAVIADSHAAFVRDEVAAGRCTATATEGGGFRVLSPLAILVGPAGTVRQVVPQAIHCATVEQFTVGYVLSLTRNSPAAAAVPTPGWYRLTVTYRW